MQTYPFRSQPAIQRLRRMAPGAQSLPRLLLFVLTLLWLPGVLVGWLAWAGQWPGASAPQALRYVLWALLGVQTAALLVGWGVIGWQTLAARLRRPKLKPIDLAELQSLSPSEFEVWVQRLFESRGYQVVNTPDSADHGIDLRARAVDGALAIVQCKRYSGVVGEPAVRDLYGVMEHEDAAHGFLVTTGAFSQAARQWAADRPIELIDGQRLLHLAARPAAPLAAGSAGEAVDG